MATSSRHVKRRERLKKYNKMKRESRKQPAFLDDQNWKPFEVDMSAFADEEMGGFVGMEVLTDYDPNMLRKLTSGTVGKESKSLKKVQDVQKPLASKTSIEKKVKGNQKNKKKGTTTNSSITNPKKSTSSKDKQRKSADVNARTKQETAVESKDVEDALKSKEKEASPGKSGVRKRKSGRERLEELRAKRKRRKSEQAEGEDLGVKEEKKEPKNSKEEDNNGREIPSTEVAMSKWDSLSVPTVVHQSLQSMGFTRPTPIQAGCIPAAINEGKDIVGAAETGSGKTLAFGIPLIYKLLQHRAARSSDSTSKTKPNPSNNGTDITRIRQSPSNHERTNEHKDQDADLMEEVASDGDINDDLSDNSSDDDVEEPDSNDDIDSEVDDVEGRVDMQRLKSQMKCVDVIDNIADEDWVKAGLPLTSTPAGGLDQEQKLFGLVLTPTRELAVQVKNHLVAAAKMTDIKVAVVVGGMSAEKQKRVLKKRPDIIVGTPGRLWELYKLGEPHLASLPDIQCLVMDEADRMVEKGHYAELSEILDLLNSSEQKSSRQTFVFSATLSLIHLGPLRKSLKKAYKQDKKDKLDSVMAKVGIREDAEVVDLTKREGTASTLLESKIVCAVEEKDIYLFYFLRQYPGRTLVFTNSIDCIRRLVSILSLLECTPLPLHSSMIQKQRLKNLERFTKNPKGLLLATDVAARGLDIPDIEHVIHYQVPRTSESYVHRSGRTARQAKSGLSVTLVSPNEMNFYRRLCKTLNREEIPSFPVEHSYYQAVKERVDLAREIDKLEHVHSKKKHQNDWFVRAAKELDVDVDEHLNLHDMGDSSEQKQFNKKMRMMRGHLKALLKRRIFAAGYSQRYLTSQGKLITPFSQATVGSHEAFSKLKARIKKDKEDDGKEKEKKRKKFKRMGRYQKRK
ncbi:ATP-dependent RNA helicase DDX24-like isoform X2 [Lytechinus variegatus]|uniref:ATP-dependent RNA helicase DDX24-like isoform X2 n=1 Tax=Lytechinus variegatus TaxID=7654 RepID=UPI001BB19E7D|nr:ATP-dependent RNA helicase DDX24-like isoform X2 [Lytechinus variegatus]